MLNKKGQALVEFVMILPVFLLLVFGAIDFGKIIYEKYTLQNKLDVIVNLYQNQNYDKMNMYINENNLSLETNTNDNLITLSISKKLQISTPGINKVLDNPYIVSESITIINENIE